MDAEWGCCLRGALRGRDFGEAGSSWESGRGKGSERIYMEDILVSDNSGDCLEKNNNFQQPAAAILCGKICKCMLIAAAFWLQPAIFHFDVIP